MARRPGRAAGPASACVGAFPGPQAAAAIASASRPYAQNLVQMPHPRRPGNQIPSSIRPGSSSASLIATRNCTASRPSMMR